MTDTRLSLLVLLAVVAVGRVGLYYRRRWLRVAAIKVERQIRAGGYRYRKGYTVHDEALQQRTATRRQAAEKIRIRARHVESGEKVYKLLEIVKRG